MRKWTEFCGQRCLDSGMEGENEWIRGSCATALWRGRGCDGPKDSFRIEERDI